MDGSFSPQTVQVLCMFLGAISSSHKFAIHNGLYEFKYAPVDRDIYYSCDLCAQHTDGNPNDYVLD